MTSASMILTGASGMLGSRFAKSLQEKGLLTLSREKLDITRPRELIDGIVAASPSVIINCAADTNVEKTESDPAPAFSANALLPGLLAQAARETGALLVHFSSTGCYGRGIGDSLTPHSDFDAVYPTTVHHKSKVAGEVAIREAGCRHLILRLGWLYGGGIAYRRNFVWARILEARAQSELSSDPHQIGSPTHVDDVVAQALHLLETRLTGTFNCVAEGAVARFDYVKRILDLAGLAPRMIPKRFARLAPVSPNEAASNDKLKLLGLNRMPGWEEALSKYVDALLAEDRIA